MRIVQYQTNDGASCVGIVNKKNKIIPVPESPRLIDLLYKHPDLQSHLQQYKDGAGLPLDSVKLLSPITHPDKVICIGMNYKDHCEEQNPSVPVTPVIFSKWGSVITGPYDDVVHPDNTTQLDWEV